MIDFKSDNYRKSKGVNILSYEQIEEITKTLLNDYDKSYLKEPKKLDVEDFALNYLNASNFDYQYICAPKGAGEILGATTFEKCEIKVYDKESSSEYIQKYDKYSIILSRELVDGKRKSQHGITGFHECGHLYMHKSYFSCLEEQMSLDINLDKRLCNRTHIEMYKNKKINTPQDWIEWQATIFAVTIALNADSIAIVMDDILKRNCIKNNIIIEDDNIYLAHECIPKELSAIYGISKEAIIYRLKKLGYYMTKDEYIEFNNRITVFDFIK